LTGVISIINSAVAEAGRVIAGPYNDAETVSFYPTAHAANLACANVSRKFVTVSMFGTQLFTTVYRAFTRKAVTF
jgi:hypothetical protein